MGAALAGLWDLLLPGGLLAVAVPGERTFRAWREAHERRGLPCGLQDFPSATQLAGLFPQPPAITEEHHPLALTRALDLPRHLKRVGGFVPRPGHVPLAPADFRAVLADLDAARPGMGYHVLYALAFKAPQE
jgi:malonyl-CoA O-methyltransferase